MAARGVRRTARLLALVAAVLAVGVLAGASLARAVDGLLAVEFRDKDVLAAELPAGPGPAAPAAPPTLAPRLALPAGAGDDPLLALAADHLAAALTERTGQVAEVGESLAGAAVTAVLDAGAEVDEQAYRVDAAPAGPAESVTVTGSDRRGLAAGLFRMAADLRAGHGWEQVSAPGVVAPAAGRRFVDAGAVGIPADPGAWRAQSDYSHVTNALGDVLLDGEPWVDTEALAEADAQWREYVDHVVAYGYNGVVVSGFLEYVTFSGIGDGTEVYAPDSTYVARARALREHIGGMWSYAERMGMDVVLVTDMLALSAPLEEYLREPTGALDPADPRLWDTYGAALDELFTEMPYLDGIMLRIGEAGGIYNARGWDYYSRLAVTRPDEVREMLTAFSVAAAEHDAEVFFRTWSVGVGEVGDLHTNPETYERVLGGLAPENLVVSTKFVSGDFDSYLPLNPTLLAGEQRRLVELQARREFEAFSAFPNAVAADHQVALQRVRGAGGGGLAGVWVWTQSGGPQRAGPLSLYLREGFWQLYDLDVWAAAQLAWNPDADLGQVVRDWVATTWAAEPAARDALVELLGQGRRATLDGLYVRPYAERDVRAFGLELPPMMWLFKWDLLSGDTATWSALHRAGEGRVDEAVAGGESAVQQVEDMQALLDEVPASAFRDPAARDALASSLAYQQDMFTVLGAYRETMLRYYEWVHTGSPAALDAHRDARDRFEAARDRHVDRWSGDLDHPPLVFANASAGLAVVSHDPLVTWLARAVLAAVVLSLVLSRSVRRAVLVPWRMSSEAGAGAGAGRWAAVLLGALAVVAWVSVHGGVSGFASLPYFATAAGATAAFAVAYLAVAGMTGGRAAVAPALAALGGATVLSALPLLVALARRGTTAAWSGFWLDGGDRTLFLVAHVTAVVWAGTVLAATAALLARSRVRAVAAAGATLAGAGLAAVTAGSVTRAVGLERYLTLLNDAMAIVPFGLSRILGITAHLGIPTALPTWLLVGGGAAAALVLAAAALSRLAGAPAGVTPRQG